MGERDVVGAPQLLVGSPTDSESAAGGDWVQHGRLHGGVGGANRREEFLGIV